jgi:ankyrin repeat protein
MSEEDEESYLSNEEEEEDYDAFNQFVNGDPYKIIDWISEGHVDKDARDDDHGESLLIWACRHRIFELATFLITQGCDVTQIAHSDGLTALDLCYSYPDMERLLRDHGAQTADDIWAEEEMVDITEPTEENLDDNSPTEK